MSYTNLTYHERECIEFFCSQNMSQREMSKLLKRHASTINREIRRNRHPWHGYQAAYAQRKFEGRKCGQLHRPVLDNPSVFKMVRSKLKQGWAPHVIAGRAKLEKSPLSVSTESIYRLVYADSTEGGRLWSLLPSFRKRRKKRLGRPDRRGQIQGRRFIEERPASANNRSRFGHWEGDTLIGKGHRGVIFTCIERKSRFVLSWKALSKEAGQIVHCARQAFKMIPRKLRKTLTVDNGLEFSEHKAITKSIGPVVYFCNPGCPQEKGGIENGNKFFRKYYPKSERLDKLTHWQLKKTNDAINNIPRKILGYRTPYEILFNNGKIALQI